MEDGGFQYSFARYSAFAGISFFVGLIFFAHPARSADITELGSSGSPWPPFGNVLSADGGPYLIDGDLTVEPGQTITFEPGVIIKLTSGSQLFVRGILNVSGTADNPVVFTSYRDDEYGGDTNNDESASHALVGDWARIYVYNNASLLVDYGVFRYGSSNTTYGMIQLGDGSDVEISHSVLEYAGNGIRMGGTTSRPSSLVVSDSVFQYNFLVGLRASGASSATVSGSIFSENPKGVWVHDIVSGDDFSFSNNSFVNNSVSGFSFNGVYYGVFAPLDLRGSWWGSSLGPTHSDNPVGDGDALSSESGDVLFFPWAGVDPSLPPNNAPVLSFVSDEGYVDDGVEPNIAFVNQNMPMFQVAFSDEDDDAAEYVRLVVEDSAYAMATTVSSTFSFAPSAGIFGKGEYEYHFEAGDGVSSVRLPESGELSFEVRFVPVVLVPGISGSVIKQEVLGGLGDITLWPNFLWSAVSVAESYMEPLSMNEDGLPSDLSVYIDDIFRKVTIFGSTVFDYTDGIISSLESNGYQEGVDLFVFPYDWRFDIDLISDHLKDRINVVIEDTGAQKVDIVAHSMGGLVVKQYILNNSISKINKSIFVGTPHIGSPKAVKILLYGDNLGIPVIMNPYLVKSIARNMMSVYQLLPSQQYISQIGKYFYDLTQQKSFTHDEVNSYLAGEGMNLSHLQTAEDFHSDAMDNFDLTGIDAYNIIGCDTATLGRIIIRNQELVDTEYGIEFVPGDGTVPFGSATAIDADSEKTFYAKGIEHATMPSQVSIKQLITQIITGNIDISGLSDITQDMSQCVFNGQVVSVHSPVDLHVYDNNGNHVGPDENGDIELNIAGATYEQIGDNKFVFIPNVDGVSYNIELDGTDTGTFSLRVSKVEDNEITETAYYSDIPVNSSSEATITLSENVSSTILEVDEAGSGSFETVSTSSVLNTEQSADTTKPITTISVSGGTNSAEFALSASDDNSGILKTEYSLDNGQTWNNYASSVIINTIGNTEVLFRSKDKAGNFEDYQSETIRISSAAVIITPLMGAPSNTKIDRHSDRAYPRAEESRESELEPKVRGVEFERPKRERYSDSDILNALTGADIATLMDYLGQTRNINLEQSISEKYSNGIVFTQAEINFISYGTKSTASLGAGERAGVIYSFKEAFNRLPETNEDWNDIIRISTNQAPIQRNAKVEQMARSMLFPLLYSGDGQSLPRVFRGGEGLDEQSIMMITYGIRPERRDLEKEVQGITEFVKKYGRVPSSTLDWNILRSIVY